MVKASDEEYNDQNVPVGTVVSRRVVSGIPEGLHEGAAGVPSGSGAPMDPQQVRGALLPESSFRPGLCAVTQCINSDRVSL